MESHIGNAVSPQRMLAYSKLGQWLYRPEEVWPYLRQSPRPSPLCPVRDSLGALARWVMERVEHRPDDRKWDHPDRWQSPAETLWQGTGSAGEMALILWSGAALWGLPPGQLVLGTLLGRGHAWVELPEVSLCAEATGGHVIDLGLLPAIYRPSLRVYPPAPAAPGRSGRPGRPALSLVR